jgi:hypothetical protein
MRAARPLLGEKPASGAVRAEVDGDNDSLKTYFMPAGGATSAMGQFLTPALQKKDRGAPSSITSNGPDGKLRFNADTAL